MYNQYLNQLKRGCVNGCGKVFCRIRAESKTLKRVSCVLSEYGDIFLCQNQSKITQKYSSVAAKFVDRGKVILDYMFFLIAFLEEGECHNKAINFSQEKENSLENKRELIKRETFDLVEKKSNNDIKCKEVFENEECITLEMFDFYERCLNTINQKECHTYCNFLKKPEYSEEDLILFEGVLYLLVDKFRISSNYFLRSFIIRVFSIVIKDKKINSGFSKILSKSFYDMQNMYNEMLELKSANTAKDICNQKEFCFINPRFTFEDYKNTKLNLGKCLEKQIKIDIRENDYLVDLLNIYKILYLINEKTKIFSYEDFYLKNFSRRINIHEEFCYYKNSQRSIFDFTFILALSTKSDFIKYENSDLVKESLQETFFRALFEGEKVPYFYITINRSTIYSQTLKLLRKTPNFDLRKQVKVIFNKEEGEDQGGIKKEYFQLLSEEIREEKRLFENKDNILWFKLNGSYQRPEYECIGKIIGIALYNNVVLNLPFPTLFFKRLLDKDTELEDLKEIDEQIFHSLKNLLRMSDEEISSSGQTFYICYQSGDDILEKKLIKNGDKIHVTKENVNFFVTRYYKFLTVEAVEPFMRSIRRGFLSVIQPTSFEFLHARELKK